VARKKRKGEGLVAQLLNAIHASGQTLTELSKSSGVSLPQLSRFVRGQRTLTLPNVEKVCEALGLHLAGGDAPSKQQPKRKRQK
jgi:DNA-binding phage protein